MTTITYHQTTANVDWQEMQATLNADDFDNGRTPQQLRISFENSYAVCIAYADERIIGTARALSDGVCNAYIVDVWTLTAFRHQGIARRMMKLVMEKLAGQHVYLFTDDALGFYQKLGFHEQDSGMGRVVGTWLVNDMASE